MTSKLVNDIMKLTSKLVRKVVIMNKEEILKKSRAEHKNKDEYEKEIMKLACRIEVIVMVVLATIFFIVQMFVGGGTNWGLYVLNFSTITVISWVRGIKLRHKFELVTAIVSTILVFVFSGFHIYDLITLSAIL